MDKKEFNEKLLKMSDPNKVADTIADELLKTAMNNHPSGGYISNETMKEVIKLSVIYGIKWSFKVMAEGRNKHGINEGTETGSNPEGSS